MRPAVVIFDTLAQCNSADENSVEEMRPVLQNVALIQERLGAAVLFLHHAMKGKPRVERGSSSLRAAADLVIRLERKDKTIVVENDKQKDDEPSKKFALRFDTVVLDGGTAEEPRRSAVLVRVTLPTGESDGPSLTTARRRVLEELVAASTPLTSGEWRARLVEANGEPMTKDAFQKHRGPPVEGWSSAEGRRPVSRDRRGKGVHIWCRIVPPRAALDSLIRSACRCRAP